MFRKPKKNPKAKFRSKKRETEEEVDTDSNKRFRSGGDDHEDDGEQTSTSTLLKQARTEQRQKHKSSFLNSNEASKEKEDVMQQFDTSDKPSDKDLATRTAEHHPEEKGGDAKKDAYEEIAEEGKTLYKGTKEVRNKFLAGPLKAPTFVRTTTRFDYQPDICKDYKDTGFCGFGDTCIYLHDRGNTMSGWQLEEEYEKKKKEEQDKKERDMDLFCQQIEGDGRANNGSTTAASESTSDSLPFACLLCRNKFTDPVVTGCNHYFCQKCIMQHVKSNGTHANGVSATTSSACPVCQKDTHGVFNYPSKLFQKRKRMECSTWEEFAEKCAGT
jgi:RING finger protein 113A